MKERHIKHLYWRAGFGVDINEFKKIKNFSKRKILNKLFRSSKKSVDIDIDLSEFSSIKNKNDFIEKIKDSSTKYDILNLLNSNKTINAYIVDDVDNNNLSKNELNTLIKFLLKNKGMTIEGVKTTINSNINKLDDYNKLSLKTEYYKSSIKTKTKNLLEKIKKIKDYGKENSS